MAAGQLPDLFGAFLTRGQDDVGGAEPGAQGGAVDQNVATLRAEVGRNPYDKALSDLIGELSTRGDTFRQRWARHEVRRHRAGVKRLNHPIVGPMTFTYETMELTADQGLYLIACTAAPGSRDADALILLASWSATDTADSSSLPSASGGTIQPPRR
ncbi:MAG: hypothetical protein ACRDOA_05100 [Streptosporangiaceae bacterium]